MENKYEAKEAWAVRKFSLNLIRGIAIYKNDKPVSFYRPSSTIYYTPNEVVIFDTKNKANSYSNEKKSEYKALAKQTLSNIKMLDNISPNIVQ